MRVGIGDVRLFFDVEGAGLVPDGPAMRARPTLILLHGGPGFDHSGFKPAYGVLAEDAQVIYLDHRGMGRSDRSSPDRWNLDQWADDLKDFCDALEIESPVILGQSFGGFVAQRFAARHPERLGRLILSSNCARQNLPRVVRAFERLAGAGAGAVAQRFFSEPSIEAAGEYARVCMPLYRVRAQDTSERMSRAVFQMDLLFGWAPGEGAEMDLRDDLSRVICPTLILAGEEDPLTSLEAAQEMADCLPPEQVHFERFAQASHALAHDRPEAYFAAVRAFIGA